MSNKSLFLFRLYVAGHAPHSVRALENLQAICCEHLPGRHQIEVVDVVAEPERALQDDVLLTPTLVKLAPPPVKKIIGNLSDTPTVLRACGLKPTR